MIKFANSQDPTNNGFTDFLLQNGVWLAIVVSAVVATIVVLLLVFANRKKPKPYEKPDFKAIEIYAALGGKENVAAHHRTGSRISIVLLDDSKLDEKALNQLGVASIIKMSKKITLVVKDDAEDFYRIFE